MDYKNTLNLPRTDFAMKADLVTREPERLKKWQTANLYEKIQQNRATAEKFVLHDGPPFANGDVHIGTALNKILKDIIIKYQTLRGKSAPYIPGWDCHGLPIEFKVSQDMRKAGDTSADAATIRKACEAYARKYIDIQRGQFKRLGVLGDWENPYLTLNKEYEANELRLFADIVAKDFVYRGKKPVYWSIPCRTALAEAEVEYHEHVSQSVFVKFPVVSQPKTFVVIWTTTPWTLPANLAVAFNPNFQYSRIKVGDEKFIICDRRLIDIAAQCGFDEFENEKSLPAEELASIEYHHPFCVRTGRLFPAAFVDDSTGTGFVHIAPGHGLDDYNLGRQNGLPIYSPVDDDGALANTNELPVERQMPAELLGKSILEKHGKKSDANEAVLALLREKNVLLHQEDYTHSYPYCWRSKTPVIFRAMDQWFIKVDHQQDEWKKLFDKVANQSGMFTTLSKDLGFDREKEGGLRSMGMIAALDEKEVEWIPKWGSTRIYGALASRPDWCISRQRTWGVPIPAFYDEKGEPILDAQTVRNAADLIEKHGSNVWFEKSASELWSLVKPANWTGAEAVSKSNDTLDVWIDSGSSSRAVLKQRKELQHDKKSGDEVWQADVYLEGSDQHRGWFQSSLLLSLAGNGAVPFKTVLTHGFMVDADREKISKSKQGAYEKPQTAEAYVKKYGADVVRLWVASQDYRSDIVVSEERINKVGETYRAIRNALRYQLSNLFDFDPNNPAHKIPDEKLTGLDRWILGEFSKLEAEVLAAYDRYEFHVVYQKVSQFIAVELSSVYHDVIKDRLYTDPASSPRRRSTQTALHRLVTGLCQMLAPILAFTADEAWEFVAGINADSVHESLSKRYGSPLMFDDINQWDWLKGWREMILPELEKARQAKTIGKALDAKVEIVIPQVQWQLSDSELLRELVNVSALKITVGEPVSISVSKADGQKCARCWHWETDIGQNAEHPTICGRCIEAVKQFQATQ
jgi:isoleucyl-tRNA synthetase